MPHRSRKLDRSGTIHTESKEVEHETERSHYHIIMILSYSEFDRLCYFCEKGRAFHCITP